jgi:biopolymer transport protein ExbD
MNIKNRKRKIPFVPVNAMSDVAFLLLIFIMLVSLINYRKEIKIDYPEARDSKKTSAEKNIELWVDSAGEIYLDGIPSSAAVIERAIVDMYREAPDTRVHVIADKNTAFEYVNGVLKILQLLEHRVVSFVVKDA